MAGRPLNVHAEPSFEGNVTAIEKVTPDFALPNDIVLPPHFPSFKPVGALAFQPLTFSIVVALTGQPKSDTMFPIGESKTRNYCSVNDPRFM